MCTPQIQQLAQFVAEQRALDAGIRPEDAAANGGQYGVMPRQPVQSANPAIAPSVAATAQTISEMFDPRTGQVVRKVGPARDMPMIPITKAEFDGPVVSDSINSIDTPMMRKEYSPMQPIQPIQRVPTVGELLGIKPGSVTEVGGPGRF
jgi:hypothetical protein